MLGSDDREEEELEADEALWDRLRSRASDDGDNRATSTRGAREDLGSEGYGEEPTGAFDRNDPAITNAFEQEDYDDDSAIAHGDLYELHELQEADVESDDSQHDGDAQEFAAYGAQDEQDQRDDELDEDEDEDEDEEDEEALWAQARASLELSKQDELAREQAAQQAQYGQQRASFEHQAFHEQQAYGQQHAYDAQAEGEQLYEQHDDGLYDDSAYAQHGEGHDPYQRQSYVAQHGYEEQAHGFRQSEVGLVAPAQHDGYGFGQPQAFGEAPYSQAASTGFPPQAAPGAFNQQAWAANFDVPDDGSSKRRSGRSGLAKGLIGALVLAAAAGAGGYQFVLVPQQQRARAAELAALQAQQQKAIEQERAAKEAAARAEAEQRAASEAALKRAEEAAAAAAVGATDVKSAVPEAGKPTGKAKASSSEGGESRAERKARERAERKEKRASAKAARAEKRERSAKASEATLDSEGAETRPTKKGGKKADAPAAANEADNDDPLFGL